MILKVIGDSTRNRTYGWDPPSGVEWYLFYANGVRVSNDRPVSESGVVKKTVTFSKGSEPHEVVAILRRQSIMSVDVGRYPGPSESDEEYTDAAYGSGVYSR